MVVFYSPDKQKVLWIGFESALKLDPQVHKVRNLDQGVLRLPDFCIISLIKTNWSSNDEWLINARKYSLES